MQISENNFICSLESLISFNSSSLEKVNLIIFYWFPIRKNPKYDLNFLCKKNHPKLIEWFVIC